MKSDLSKSQGQCKPHYLDPLLKPQSVAFVGSSKRRNSAGNIILRNLLPADYRGKVYPVNPSYDSILGWPCYASIELLPEVPDLAVIAVPNRVLEAVTRQVIAVGVKALVIFATAEMEGDEGLKDRLTKILKEANIPVCGANGMGFFTPRNHLRVYTGYHPEPVQIGGLTYIAQSGSLLQALLFNDERLKFNLAVSSGQELITTVSDYMDYALNQPETQVIALSLESVRNPEGFIKALRKAREREIPVVVLKLGRSEAGARFALSHTGAIAGDTKVYEALFKRYGVISVEDLSEMANTLILLLNHKKLGPGGISAILDSGGERQLIVDIADDNNVPMANISDETKAVLENTLDYGLTAENPVDAWGTGNNFEHIYETCLSALMKDEDTSLGIFVADLSTDLDLHEGYIYACEAAANSTDKPIIMMTNYSAWSHRKHAIRLGRLGIPVLDGTTMSFRAIKHAINYRDFLNKEIKEHPLHQENKRAHYWRERLRSSDKPFTEDEGYRLLHDYGINVPAYGIVESAKALPALIEKLGFPLVAKTAEPGILHKSDVGGVVLNIHTIEQAHAAYSSISSLGSRVLFSRMEQGTVELAFGLVKDDSFGCFVMVACGGIWIELMKDSQLAMLPIDHDEARQRIDSLKIAKIIDGARGAPPCDKEALIEMYVSLSRIASDLGDDIAEMDINPVLVSPEGVVAVDSLIVPTGHHND